MLSTQYLCLQCFCHLHPLLSTVIATYSLISFLPSTLTNCGRIHWFFSHFQKTHALWVGAISSYDFASCKTLWPFFLLYQTQSHPQYLPPFQLSNFILSLVLHSCVWPSQFAYCPGHLSCSELLGGPPRMSRLGLNTHWPSCWEYW